MAFSGSSLQLRSCGVLFFFNEKGDHFINIYRDGKLVLQFVAGAV